MFVNIRFSVAGVTTLGKDNENKARNFELDGAAVPLALLSSSNFSST
jgi:hypothetical protein